LTSALVQPVSRLCGPLLTLTLRPDMREWGSSPHAQNRLKQWLSSFYAKQKSLRNGYTHGVHHRCAATP
jgi:hypothetical protein